MGYKKGQNETDLIAVSDYDLNCYAVLLDITLEEFKKAMIDTGMSAEEILKKYFHFE